MRHGRIEKVSGGGIVSFFPLEPSNNIGLVREENYPTRFFAHKLIIPLHLKSRLGIINKLSISEETFVTEKRKLVKPEIRLVVGEVFVRSFLGARGIAIAFQRVQPTCVLQMPVVYDMRQCR